ncbi:MAG: hypothetical protein Q4C01_07645, partial [Clostridia bacterium]|nr:hypothetical protein [Clostridia bacterium]
VEPTPTPGTGLTAGNYKISVTHNGTIYYLTNTVENSQFSSTTDVNAATVWTLAVSGDGEGYTLADPDGNYLGKADDGSKVSLGATAEVWTWDATNSWLVSSTASTRALAGRYRTDNSQFVFRYYATNPNATDAEYAFALTFTPVV